LNEQNEDFGLSVTKIENKPDEISKLSNINSFQNSGKIGIIQNQPTHQKRKVNLYVFFIMLFFCQSINSFLDRTNNRFQGDDK
jgi:hypothetical protein